MDDVEKILKILEGHSGKSFVQRILDPDQYPKLDLGDGKSATHLMSWGESDGKYLVFPTVLYDNGRLQQYKPDDAFSTAISSGNYIEFDRKEDADWFSKNYKKVWK